MEIQSVGYAYTLDLKIAAKCAKNHNLILLLISFLCNKRRNLYTLASAVLQKECQCLSTKRTNGNET